jgi:hypothetical protein
VPSAPCRVEAGANLHIKHPVEAFTVRVAQAYRLGPVGFLVGEVAQRIDGALQVVKKAREGIGRSRRIRHSGPESMEGRNVSGRPTAHRSASAA